MQYVPQAPYERESPYQTSLPVTGPGKHHDHQAGHRHLEEQGKDGGNTEDGMEDFIVTEDRGNIYRSK